MTVDKHAPLKYRYGNRKFWFRGYYVDIVGRNRKKIEKYIHYYNHKRIKIKLAGMSPVQYRIHTSQWAA